MYWVYVLESGNRSWYIGFTPDLRRRFYEHRTGDGGHTTSQDEAWELIYCEGYKNKNDAVKREKFLKSGSGYSYLKKQLKYHREERKY